MKTGKGKKGRLVRALAYDDELVEAVVYAYRRTRGALYYYVGSTDDHIADRAARALYDARRDKHNAELSQWLLAGSLAWDIITVVPWGEDRRPYEQGVIDRLRLEGHPLLNKQRASYDVIPSDIEDEIVRLYDNGNGLLQRVIAERLGLSQGGVSRALRRRGIQGLPHWNRARGSWANQHGAGGGA